MRQYVLTRSAYGPAWDLASNRRRLRITATVTARLMELQTVPDWTWIVALDPRDPLLKERLDLYEASAPHFCPLIWQPPPYQRGEVRLLQRLASDLYVKAPWRSVIGPADDVVLQSRIDDDDGLAPDALARYRAAGELLTKRTILMLPHGVRVFRGLYDDVQHKKNAMHCLVTPPGDKGCVYDYGHMTVMRIAPILTVDQEWGWLWVRHRDSISGGRRAGTRMSRAVHTAFPIDWRALDQCWSA